MARLPIPKNEGYLPRNGVLWLGHDQRIPSYMARLLFPFKNKRNEEIFAPLKEELKKLPGVHYAPDLDKKSWVCPWDLEQEIRSLATSFTCDLWTFPPKTKRSIPEHDVTGLYPYQAADIPRILSDRGFLVAHEMGLGKTAEAIRALQPTYGQKLVICPAVVRQAWRDQLQKWASETPALRVTKGEPWAYDAKWVVSSYECLNADAIKTEWHAVVVDESHMVKNDKAARSILVHAITECASVDYILELTGTPIADSPEDLHNQLDILYPGRYGTIFQFKKRYCNAIPNPFATSGWTYEGLNPDHADELRDRLSRVSSRTTKKDVAHLLPPLTVTATRIPPATYLPQEQWGSSAAYEDWLGENADVRVRAVREWAESALESEKNILIFTHLRHTAALLSKALEKDGLQVTVITGELDPEKRNPLIKKALDKPGVIVATIGSVGVGIDSLGNVPCAAFAELSYYPMEVLQAMSRVHRLSSTKATSILFFIFEGTIDEKIVLAIESKVGDANRILKAGLSEEGISTALAYSPDDWAAHMRAVAENCVEEL